jgi:hypothetical protein
LSVCSVRCASLIPIEVVLYKDKLNRDKIEWKRQNIDKLREFAVLFFLNIL